MSCSAQVCKTASQELLHILWGSCLTRNGPGTNTVGIGGRNYTQKYQVFRPGVVFLLSTVNSLTSHLQHQTYLETVVNPQTLRCMLGKCGYGLCNCTLCVCVFRTEPPASPDGTELVWHTNSTSMYQEFAEMQFHETMSSKFILKCPLITI